MNVRKDFSYSSLPLVTLHHSVALITLSYSSLPLVTLHHSVAHHPQLLFIALGYSSSLSCSYHPQLLFITPLFFIIQLLFMLSYSYSGTLHHSAALHQSPWWMYLALDHWLVSKWLCLQVCFLTGCILFQLSPSPTACKSPQVAVLKLPLVGGTPNSIDSSDGSSLQCRWQGCHQFYVQMDDLVNHVNVAHVKVERDVEYKCRWEGCPRNGRGFNAR